MIVPSNRLNQHGAAKAAADTFSGDAALSPEPLHRVDEIQHNAVAASPDRMAETNGTAIDIQLGLIELRQRRPQDQAPRGRISSSFHAARQASSWDAKASLIFPGLDVLKFQIVALQQFRRRQYRTKAHNGGIQSRPCTVDNDSFRLEAVFVHSLFRCEDCPAAPSVI